MRCLTQAGIVHATLPIASPRRILTSNPASGTRMSNDPGWSPLLLI